MTIDAQLEALRGSVPDVVIARARRLINLTPQARWKLDDHPGVFDLRCRDGFVRVFKMDGAMHFSMMGFATLWELVEQSPRLAALEDLGEASLEAARIRDEGAGAFGGYDLFRAELEQALVKQSEALDRLRATEKA
jgi:hypothetical protein